MEIKETNIMIHETRAIWWWWCQHKESPMVLENVESVSLVISSKSILEVTLELRNNISETKNSNL